MRSLTPYRAAIRVAAIAAAGALFVTACTPGSTSNGASTPTKSATTGVGSAPVTLKLELLQRTGSFKLRGACNRMLAGDVPAEGVIAASGGNFGIATAYAARSLSHRAEVFVPDTSPAVKVDRLRELGADVRLVPGYYADALEASTRS